MKKIATATIATAGIATLGMAHHHADAAENTGQGAYNPNDPSSYSYSYTIDKQGNYNYDWQGNWSPNQAQQGQQSQQAEQGQAGQQNNQSQQSYSNNYGSNNQKQSYTTNNVGGKGASYSTSDKNVQVKTQSAPQSNSNGSTSFAGKSSAGGNSYDSGQCTYYVYDKVGGKIGSDWGNASNWANKAAQSGYTVDNSPKSGSILQTSQGAYGHVAYVDNVNSDGSVKVSEMNYGQGPGVVTSRTISASEAGSYNYIK